jgi:hypothetical protein
VLALRLIEPIGVERELIPETVKIITFAPGDQGPYGPQRCASSRSNMASAPEVRQHRASERRMPERA